MDTFLLTSKTTAQVLEFFGPCMWFLVPPSADDCSYCVMRGAIPAGVSVPLHSHPEDESFFILSGLGEVYAKGRDGYQWNVVHPGEMVHIPGGMKHAWRNLSDKSLESIVTTTSRLGRFFLDVGRALKPGEPPQPPTEQELQHFAKVAQRYGQWLGSPYENACIGIPVFGESQR